MASSLLDCKLVDFGIDSIIINTIIYTLWTLSSGIKIHGISSDRRISESHHNSEPLPGDNINVCTGRIFPTIHYNDLLVCFNSSDHCEPVFNEVNIVS